LEILESATYIHTICTYIFIENQVQARNSTGSAAKHQIGIDPLVGHFDRNAEFARRLKSSFGTGAIHIVYRK
jgi:hypothetical protein